MSAIIAGQLTKQAIQQAQSLDKRLDFDFSNLIIKLAIFFILAYAINKLFEAIILGQNTLFAFLGLFGVNLPATLPQSIVTFMTDGFHGVKYWDVVKLIGIILVVMEWHIWFQGKENPSPLTSGIFFVLITGMSIFTIPELLKRVKEMQILSATVVNR